MGDFVYARLVTPKRWCLGYSGPDRVPFFDRCGDCGQPDAVIEGILQGSDGRPAIQRKPGCPFFVQMIFCSDCFEKRLQAETEGKELL